MICLDVKAALRSGPAQTLNAKKQGPESSSSSLPGFDPAIHLF
jgi:hypothetical protein